MGGSFRNRINSENQISGVSPVALLSITATALARNFSDLLNQVRYQRVSLEVKRGNEVVAIVTPPPGTAGFPIDQLDALLQSAPVLSAEEADGFLRDIHEANDRLIPESTEWDS